MASSTDGDDWQWGGVWTIPVQGNLRIGLISMNATGATAEFEYVRTYDMGGEPSAFPASWPVPMPYGAADGRDELEPNEENSKILDLELRPRDEERGRVWMRDTYVNCFVVDGRPLYVATGTTREPGELAAAAPWNDGIFVWVAPSLRGPWRLADTTGIRPDAEKGKVWSPEFAGENRPGRTVVAPLAGVLVTTTSSASAARNVGAGAAPLPRQVVHRRVHGRPLPQGRLVHAGQRGRGRGPVPARRGQPRASLRRSGQPGETSSSPAPTTTSTAASTPRATTRGWCCTTTCTRSSGTTWRTSSRRRTSRSSSRRRTRPSRTSKARTVFKHGGKYYLLHAAWANRSGSAGAPTRTYPPDTGTQYQYDAVVAVAGPLRGAVLRAVDRGRRRGPQQLLHRRGRAAVGDVLPESGLRLLGVACPHRRLRGRRRRTPRAVGPARGHPERGAAVGGLTAGTSSRGALTFGWAPRSCSVVRRPTVLPRLGQITRSFSAGSLTEKLAPA